MQNHFPNSLSFIRGDLAKNLPLDSLDDPESWQSHHILASLALVKHDLSAAVLTAEAEAEAEAWVLVRARALSVQRSLMS